jgi:hypothetical protein
VTTNTRPVPNTQSAIAASADGKTKVFLLTPWTQWFQQFTQKVPAAVAIALTGSPFLYTPNQNGNVYISGGTVSNVSLIRGLDTLDITGQKLIPVGIGDTIRITYTVAPTVKFLGT